MHQAESLQSDGQHAWTCTIRKVFGDFLVAYGGMDFHTERCLLSGEPNLISIIDSMSCDQVPTIGDTHIDFQRGDR